MADENVKVPLPEYIREAARESAWVVIREHKQTCPILKVEKRVRVLETRFSIAIGVMLGSGLLGGAACGAILKAFGA